MTELHTLNEMLAELRRHRNEIDTVIVDVQRAITGLESLGFFRTSASIEARGGAAATTALTKTTEVPAFVTEWRQLPKRARQSDRRSAHLKGLSEKYNINPEELDLELRRWLNGGPRSLYNRTVGSSVRDYRKRAPKPKKPVVKLEEAPDEGGGSTVPPAVLAWYALGRSARFGTKRFEHMQQIASEHNMTTQKLRRLIRYWFNTRGHRSRFYVAMPQYIKPANEATVH